MIKVKNSKLKFFQNVGQKGEYLMIKKETLSLEDWTKALRSDDYIASNNLPTRLIANLLKISNHTAFCVAQVLADANDSTKVSFEEITNGLEKIKEAKEEGMEGVLYKYFEKIEKRAE